MEKLSVPEAPPKETKLAGGAEVAEAAEACITLTPGIRCVCTTEENDAAGAAEVAEAAEACAPLTPGS